MENELNKFHELTDISFDSENAHLAICHKAQGGSANGWHESVLTKSDSNLITEDVIKAMKELGEDTSELEAKLAEINKAGMFSNDLQSLLSAAIKDASFVDRWDWICVCDWDDSTVIFVCDEGLFSLDYKLEGVNVTLSDVANPVVKITDYTEVNGKALISAEAESSIEAGLREMIQKAHSRPEVQTEILKATSNHKKLHPDNKPSVTVISQEPVVSNPDQIQKSNTESIKGDFTVELDELMKSAEFADLLKAKIAEATAGKDAELIKASEQISVLKAAEEKRKEASLVTFAKSMSYLDEADQTDLVKALMSVEAGAVPAVVEMTKALNKANEAMEVLKATMTQEVGQNGEKQEVQTSLEKAAGADDLMALIEARNSAK